jgi:hypothetical protein
MSEQASALEGYHFVVEGWDTVVYLTVTDVEALEREEEEEEWEGPEERPAASSGDAAPRGRKKRQRHWEW